MGLIKMYARPIKYKVNGPGTEQTADGFVATPVRYSTISVEDLAEHIAADSHVERSKVAVITDSLIKQIREMVLNGHKIVVPHLGCFKPKIKSQLAINPESVDATSFSAKVRFTPSVELKRDLQSARIEKTTLPVAPADPSIGQQKSSLMTANVSRFIKLVKERFNVDLTSEEINTRSYSTVRTSAEDVEVMGNTLVAEKNNVTYYYYGYVKAKDDAAKTYSYFDGTGNFVRNAKRVDISGWDPVDSAQEKKYWDPKEFKFTEPFSED